MKRNPFAKIFRLASREPDIPGDVEQEIDTHLAELTDWLVANGMSREGAREEAARRFGDRARVRRTLRSIDRSSVRRQRVGERLDGWRQDLVFAARGLRRSPGYAAVVVGTLGIALAANATMFGIIDRLLLRPPPGIVAPEEVKRVLAARWFDGHLSEPWASVSYPSFEGLRDHGVGFSHVAAVASQRLSHGLGLEARQVDAVLASGQYFDLLGVVPELGRLFHEADDRPPRGNPVVVLSHGFWRDRMGANPSVVGTSILLNGQRFEVIGVADATFQGIDLARVDLWLPFSSVEPIVHPNSEWRTARGWQWLNVIVRVKSDVPIEQVLTAATQGYRQANEAHAEYERKAVPTLRAVQDYGDENGRRIAGWLYGVTVVVLLIACANVANVVLARGTVRKTETAVRQALGVSSGRLFRQFVVETGLVMVLGLVLGLVLTRWGGLIVRRLLLAGTVWDSNPVNFRVLAATAVAAIGAAMLASLWPLLRSARIDIAAQLHGAGRTTGRQGAGTRRGLLLVQTTLCTGLVALAALFLESLGKVRRLDVGIDTESTMLAWVDLDGMGATDHDVLAFYRRAAEQVRRIPGVAAAGFTMAAPFMANMGVQMRVPGRDTLPRLAGGGPYSFEVGPGTLEAYGVRLLDGRLFTEADRAGSAPVVVVGRRLAETVWPGERAIGKCIIVGDGDSLPCREVVGVVADVNRQEIEEKPYFLFFGVLEQNAVSIKPQFLVVRTAPGVVGLEGTIRRTLLQERADLPFVQIQPYSALIARQSRPWRLGASLLSVFAGVSLLIAGIGLYGVVAFAVSQRTRELGLRAALGASPRRLLNAVVRSGLTTALVGAVLGVSLALGFARRIEPLLFHTRANSPGPLALAAVVVILVSLVAAWVPGRRATRLDPVQALRVE